jgi:outer membrane biosynthesis protein TonB
MTVNTIRFQQELQSNKKIRGKAKTYSVFGLILLLVALLLPFCHQIEEQEAFYDNAILVTFEEEDFKELASAQKSSTEAAANAPAASDEETTDESSATTNPVETETPPEDPQPNNPSKVDPVPIQPSNQKPILTSSEPSEINIKDELKALPKDAQVEEVSEEVTEITSEVSPDFMAELADYFKKTESTKPSKPGGSSPTSGSSTGGNGTANTDKPGNGTSSTPGQGTSGKSETGDSKTDGVGNSGNSGTDFSGDGLISRKVIERADLDKIIKKNGKIVINLCINRDGIVIFQKADKAKSTIKDPLLLKKAEKAASRYRYEKDYTAAERQCGQLTVIITGIQE